MILRQSSAYIKAKGVKPRITILTVATLSAGGLGVPIFERDEEEQVEPGVGGAE